MDERVIGRRAELTSVTKLLGSVADGPAVLALWGEAGIGKTTIWSAGVEHARSAGFSALVCRPGSLEVRLTYAGLADLLGPVVATTFDRLPRPQARALDAALLRADDDLVPDTRAVAAGFLSVLDTMANTSPVLLAIDDIQWMDEPSRRVVEFAVRRCSGPVAVLTARRVDGRVHPADELVPRDTARQQCLRLGPLSLGTLHHVIRHQIGHSLPRPVLQRIAETSGGNPFFALELARSIDRNAATIDVLPRSLRVVVADRLRTLAAPVREALLVASALARPRVGLVAAVMSEADVIELLGQAEDAGVVDLSGGVVRFTHPLLATAVYSAASPSSRRALHQRLSDLVDDVEEGARHRALAAVGPDLETIEALDAAAAQARTRGAPGVAAELLGLAMSLGAEDPLLRVQAAQDHFDAGDPATAVILLEAAIPELEPGPSRAAALSRLALTRVDTPAEAAAMVEQAVEEAGPDGGLRCSIALGAVWLLFNSGRGADSLAYAKLATEEAQRGGDDGLLAVALACKMFVEFTLGHGIDTEALERALDLEDPERPTPVANQPSLIAALVYWYTARLEESLEGLAAVRQRCLDAGAEGELWFVSINAIVVACAAGDIQTANALVDELVERAHLVDTDESSAWAQLGRARMSAWIGEVDEARSAGEAALALFRDDQRATWPLIAREALGMAEMSVGNAARAADWLAPAAQMAISIGFGEPATIPFLPDAAEALIMLGRIDEAEPIVVLLEENGRQHDRWWASAVGARCRALLHSAEGSPDSAAEAFTVAFAAHDAIPQLRYDRARSLLAWGQLQRRSNQRRAAQASLTEAAHLFNEVGAAQWERNAHDELDRLGLRTNDTDELTPTEQHVAELAASGMTNREVAAALFISPKTVEAHLGRVYRKLAIHSRAELGRVMAERT